MLHRSFKPAKCKISLKLASSRIKLMKNKREAQVKQLKRELAKLLESGQDQTARIRVEHVVREEKMMAAYDLLEIYSELIVARLPIIESQKNCPIDLKEAISSVIFASPRCADVPELLDVRKHFTAKYGKDFVSAAVELRPDCGVSRLLVEKLSAKAPDGPTKVKILTAIAEEHNIKWDPMSFGEKDSKPSEDLLNGPTTFNSASQMFVNPSYVQPHSNLDDKGPSNLQVPPKSNENQGVPPIFHEHNFRQSSSSQTNSGANKTNMSAAFRPESMPTGTDTERMELRHSYSGDGNDYSMGRQNWNMKFKDAAAAARAAAESAERASMAARAAAELSSRENTTQQYSTGSRRDEEPIRYANSTLQSEHHAKGPIDIVHGRNSWMDYEQINSNQQDDVAGIAENIHGDTLKSTNKSSRSASMKSGATSADGSAFVNNLQMADRYSQKNSSELGQRDNLSEVGLRKQSSRSEVDYASKLQGLDSKSIDDFEEARIRKQPSHASSHSRSHSRSSTFSDDHDVSNYDGLSLGRDLDENPFAADNEGMIRRNSNKTSTPENASVFYDDYVSDQEEFNIDLQGQHKGREYTEFSSHSGNAPTHMFSNSNAWSERQNIDESPGISISRSHFSVEHQSDPVFSESLTSSTVPSQPGEMLPATFDDYDVPISEGEDELDRSKLLGSKDTDEGNIYSRTSEVTQVESHEFMDSSFVDEGNMGSSKPWLQSSSFNSNHVEVHAGRNQGARSSMKFNYGDVTTSQSSPGFTSSNLDFDDPYSNSQQVDERKHEQSQQPSRFSVGHEVRDNVLTSLQVESMEDTETSRESSPESGKELKFANLTGGLRNKAYKRQPYIVNPSHNVSSYKQTAEHTSTLTEERLSAPVKVSPSPGPGAASQDPYSRDMSSEADRRPSPKKGEENKKSSSRTQLKYFDSTDSDSEDDFPKEALTNKASFNTGLSQRTKISPSNSTGSFYSMATVLSEASPSPDFGEIRNSPPRRVFSHRTSQRPLYQNKISGPLGSSEQPRLEEEVGNKPIQESKRPSFKDSLKPSEKEQPSKSLRKIVTSGNTENLNTSSSSGETPSKERASHVHPKLPDYDALTAQLQSLRKNRQ